MEELRDIPHGIGYKATINGDILNKDGTKKSTRLHKTGYLYTHIHENGKKKTVQVHRMVAEAFIPNPDNKPCVNHKNGIKTDNRAKNLEWCTHSENMQHAIATGLHIVPKGKDNPLYGRPSPLRGRHIPNSNRSNNTSIRIVETGEEFKSIAECAEAIGGRANRISDILNGKHAGGHRGFHFERVHR